MRSRYRVDQSAPDYPDMSKFAHPPMPTGDPWANRERKVVPPTWKRYRIHFGVGSIGGNRTVITTKEPAKGQMIKWGKTANSCERVESVEPLPGHIPQLGDLVLG
jgi:hypothetical protein